MTDSQFNSPQRRASFSNLTFTEGVGGEKHISVRNLLDILELRTTLLSKDLARPGMKKGATEFLRGQLANVELLIRVLRNDNPGSTDPNH